MILTQKNYIEELKKEINVKQENNTKLKQLLSEMEKKRKEKFENVENENLKNQIGLLHQKLEKMEEKFQQKLAKKDLIINKLDQKLQEYETLTK